MTSRLAPFIQCVTTADQSLGYIHGDGFFPLWIICLDLHVGLDTCILVTTDSGHLTASETMSLFDDVSELSHDGNVSDFKMP